MKEKAKFGCFVTGIFLFIVGFGLGKLQTNFRNKGRVDLVSLSIQKIVLPPARIIEAGFESVDRFFNAAAHSASLQSEVTRLRNQVLSDSQYGTTIKDYVNQVNNLRQLNGFNAVPKEKKIPAEIIGTFRFENRITLNVGSANGVGPNMPVMNGQGLLAIVQNVSKSTCQAELITSPSIQLGAISLREPPATGLLHGEDSSTLIINFLDPKAPIQVGDNLITSGFSDSIPRGIPIGRVYRIDDNVDFGTRRALVFPWASLGYSKDVMVIK